MPEQRDLIAFDVGNTTVCCAIRRAGRWEMAFRVGTRPTERLGERLAQALSARDVPTGERCWVAVSVCPRADKVLAEDCRRRGGSGPEIFGRDLPIPLPVSVAEPDSVGRDRLLCALGARRLVGAPCVVVGVGTAITADLVDASGAFAGGAIAPGMRLGARALHEGTARLPLVEPELPERAAGGDTVAAIRSGLHYLCRGGVRELVARLRAEVGAECPVVVSGGDAEALLPLDVGGEITHVPDLIFRGMEVALDESNEGDRGEG